MNETGGNRMGGVGAERWTTRRLLGWTSERLEQRGVESPRLSAELMLAHVLGVDRVRLYTDLDRPASPLERAAYRELVEKASRHCPVQYLLGRAWFHSLEFAVDERVLIPRPCTEMVVDQVIQHVERTPGSRGARVADVGTGSGCIAVAVAFGLPESTVVATDVSGEALEVARANAERHGVADRVEFRRGEGLSPLGEERFDFLVSNPPYISDAEWRDVPENVKGYEPEGALRGGDDGLEVIRAIVGGAGDRLEAGGRLLVEIAASQKRAALGLAEREAALCNAHVMPDFEGHPRLLVADRA